MIKLTLKMADNESNEKNGLEIFYENQGNIVRENEIEK